jgi:hypothetical protein
VDGRTHHQQHIRERRSMIRHIHSGKRQDTRAQDDDVFCAKTGALISGAPSPNVIPFPRPVTNSGSVELKIDMPQLVDNDDI